MYERHFAFSERPFSLNPDPAFLYRSPKHEMALTMLEYGLMSEAPIIVISGEIGAGKTTVIHQTLREIDSVATVGLVSNTHKGFGELIHWVCMAFGILCQGRSKVELYHEFISFMIDEFAKGRKTVLIVDEAQNMNIETLEELRVMSNINSEKNLLLQLILVGQPELRSTLRQKQLEQFAQRISVDYHLDALDQKETREYITHRLVQAKGRRNIFTRDAVFKIYELSGGIPRLINSLCDQLLVYAFAEGRQRVTGKLVSELIAEKNIHGLLGAGRIKYEPVSNKSQT